MVEALTHVVEEVGQGAAPLRLLETPEPLDDERGLKDDEHDERRHEWPALLHLLADRAEGWEIPPDPERDHRRERETCGNDKTIHGADFLLRSTLGLPPRRLAEPALRTLTIPDPGSGTASTAGFDSLRKRPRSQGIEGLYPSAKAATAASSVS